MKIKNISCTQFAGIRDRSLSFGEGINLIYGKNESGKSTIVNLISRTLFQNAQIDKRSDKEFKDLYFPSVKKGSSVVGDFADGKISFETEKGVYTLTKEWGVGSQCSLSTPDGVIRDKSTVEAVLKEAMIYGEGVYSDMLFSSQRNTYLSLQTILDASKKTDAKKEITDAVSQAFSESDGISVDAIEQEINKKIDEIAGKHWDTKKGQVARKAGRWATGLGEILKAYYNLEDAKTVLETVNTLEIQADTAAKEYSLADSSVKLAEENYGSFHAFAGMLTVQSERRKAIFRLEKELSKIKEVLSSWPNLLASLEKATQLKKEKEQREILDKYECAKKLFEEIEELRSELCNQTCPTKQEISDLKTAQRKISSLENKLCGMNLSANIKMLGKNSVSIVSLRTGKELDVTEDSVSVTEAVKITVPGVIELELAPADVDVKAIETEIIEQKAVTDKIFKKYNVDSAESLEQLSKKIADSQAKLELTSNRLSILLGSTTYEQLKESAKESPDNVRAEELIEQDILSLCQGNDLIRYITAKETVVLGFEQEYGNIDSLKAKAYDTQTELKKAQESVKAVEDVPAEFEKISDPEAYLSSLQNELKAKQIIRENALTQKTATASKLESFKESLTGDPLDDVQTAERIFEEKKTLLNHWLHIAEVFEKQKQLLQNNPMQDIADSFAKYLGLISNGKISSEFPDFEKLSMNIYSDNSLLDYGKLSEGTKETVSLAFRLAVLDHLFPNGGGVIVFDDPFTDMDKERTLLSCKLIKECARFHQVIFLTCKEEYKSLLNGNIIEI